MNWLSGRKTYLTGIVLIALGLYQISQGQSDQGVNRILEGFGFMGLRAGISKTCM
jgi:hypothetical protein